MTLSKVRRALLEARVGPSPWDEALPGHQRLVIDGAVFLHWYDCLIALALGI